MQKIYVVKKGNYLYGPFCLQSLKEKGIRSSDVIWYEGLPQWTPALEIDFLRESVKYDDNYDSKNELHKFSYGLFKGLKKILGIF